MAIVHVAQGQGQQRRGGPEGVGEAVAVLVGQHHNLLVDAQDLAHGLENGHQDHSLAGAGAHEEVEGGDKHIDYQQGNDRALAVQHVGHGVDDGVGDVALGEDHGHGAAQADDHGGSHHAGHALAKLDAGLGDVGAGDNDRQNGYREIDGGDLRQTPLPQQGAHHGDDDGNQEGQDDNDPAGGELQALLELHRCGLLLKVILAHHAVLGVLLDLDAVAGQEEQSDHIEDHQTHGAETDTGIHGQTHQSLRHADGVGVDHAAGETDGGGQQDNGGTHHFVIAQCDEQRNNDGIEGVKGVQVTDDPQAGEQGEEQDHHGQALAIGFADQGLDSGRKRTGILDDLDAAADEQHSADDAGTLNHALMDGGEEAQKANRGLLGIGEAVGVYRVIHADIAAGRHHIGHDGDQQHQDQNDCVHVGQTKALFLLQCLSHSQVLLYITSLECFTCPPCS